MVPHIREAPNCPVFEKICGTPVSSTVDAVFVVNFDVGIRPLVSPRCAPIASIQVVDETLF
jgi:hypothetical protein